MFATAGDLQAVLLRDADLAAAVVGVCMAGLAATLAATRGPPKPDKARTDRLAYVVSAPPCTVALGTLESARRVFL